MHIVSTNGAACFCFIKTNESQDIARSAVLQNYSCKVAIFSLNNKEKWYQNRLVLQRGNLLNNYGTDMIDMWRVKVSEEEMLVQNLAPWWTMSGALKQPPADLFEQIFLPLKTFDRQLCRNLTPPTAIPSFWADLFTSKALTTRLSVRLASSYTNTSRIQNWNLNTM